MPETKKPQDASQWGYKGPRKAREFIEEKLILVNYEFYDSQWGPAYHMEVIRDMDGEIMRLSGKHTYVLDWLHAIPGPEECPIQFRFVKVGNAYVVKGWEDPEE